MSYKTTMHDKNGILVHKIIQYIAEQIEPNSTHDYLYILDQVKDEIDRRVKNAVLMERKLTEDLRIRVINSLAPLLTEMFSDLDEEDVKSGWKFDGLDLMTDDELYEHYERFCTSDEDVLLKEVQAHLGIEAVITGEEI